jgi:glutathione S-transferase
MSDNLRVFTFGPGWGLPTTGPFGLKLEVCLRMLGVPYERVYESDVSKGPKRKSPWIEEGGVRMGDSELIVEYVQRKHDRTIDRDLAPADRARGHVLRRMIEEHYHEVYEYELMVQDDGFAELRKLYAGRVPAQVLDTVLPAVRESFKKHLFERGIARHTPAEIEAMGRADVDALATWLGDREWFIADTPTKTDASAFGLLAASIRSPLPTPVCTYARSKPNLALFVDRALGHFFPELGEGRAHAAVA